LKTEVESRELVQMAGLVLLEPSPQALVVAHFLGNGCHDDAYDCGDSDNGKYGS
jgi:hypothetical protein